jgi:hypothetical protein
MLVFDAAHHRRTELRLNELARHHFSRFPGVYHVDLRHLAALGGGDMVAGETLLHRLFKMAGPRAIHPDAVRQVGNGSIANGNRVLDKFIARAQQSHGYQQGGALEPPDELANSGSVAKLTKQAANYRDPTGDEICAACSMFRPHNHSCSLVAGRISRTSVCDFYEPRESAAHG